MPAGPRIRANNSFGVTTDNPLTAGATSFNSAGLATLPVVSSAHAVVVLDPKRLNGEPEIVVVTSHSAAATVATIQRGQYGTVARSHPAGTPWAHVPVDEDYIEVLTSGTRPTNPYEGQFIYETDTDVLRGYNGTAWGTTYLDPPACRVFHNVNQTIPDAGSFTPLFNSERYDTDGMHDPGVNSSRITFNTPGLYVVGFGWDLTASNDYTLILCGIIATGSTTGTIADFSQQHNVITANVRGSVVTTMKFAVGDYIQARVYADNTAGANNRQIIASPPFSPEFWATWIGKG